MANMEKIMADVQMDFSSLCDRINNIVQDRLFQSDFDKYLGEASPFGWEASPSGYND
jgi:hypothetical protein